MSKAPEIYCSHCQKLVTPVMGLVNYHCPSCGATFMVSQVEKTPTSEDKEPAPDVAV